MNKVKPIGKAAVTGAVVAGVAFAAVVIAIALANMGYQITRNGQLIGGSN